MGHGENSENPIPKTSKFLERTFFDFEKHLKKNFPLPSLNQKNGEKKKLKAD